MAFQKLSLSQTHEKTFINIKFFLLILDMEIVYLTYTYILYFLSLK